MYLPRRFERSVVQVLHGFVRPQPFRLLMRHRASGLALRDKPEASQNRSAANCDDVLRAPDGIGTAAAGALAGQVVRPGAVD